MTQVKFVKGRFAEFRLPQLSEEEIIRLLVSEIDKKEAEKIFLSEDKKRIIYVYRKNNGTYSVGREAMKIADIHEQLYADKYGWWLPDDMGATVSFYGTVDEALKDIKSELAGYTEISPKR